MLSLSASVITAVLISLAGSVFWRRQLDHLSPRYNQWWSVRFFVINCMMGGLIGALPHVLVIAIIGILYMMTLQVISDRYRLQMSNHASR